MRNSVITVALPFVLCGAAQAQQAGNYDATLPDGKSVHFVVDENPDTHRPRVTDAQVVLPAPCAGLPTPIAPTTWWWSPGSDLRENGHFIFRSPDDSFYLNFGVRTLGAKAIGGAARFVSVVAVPNGDGLRPSICNRRNWQKLRLTWSAAPGRRESRGPSPAAADGGPQAGTYQGTTTSGQPVSLTVADNPSSGHFEIVGASVGYAVTCVAGAPAVTRTWAPDIDIVAPRTKLAFYDGYSQVEMSVVFDGASAARGTVVARQAYGTRFNDGGPRHAGICRGPWEHYTLSYTGP
ncbi:MAG TPA: hypothetical protein VG889_20705 [Rhizomicrobium sp.]|nr:hypothetical protein [Rhizomicrobium sp.]